MWWKENLVKHQKVSKYYDHVCSFLENFAYVLNGWPLCLFSPRTTIPVQQCGFWDSTSGVAAYFTGFKVAICWGMRWAKFQRVVLKKGGIKCMWLWSFFLFRVKMKTCQAAVHRGSTNYHYFNFLIKTTNMAKSEEPN